MIRKPGKVYCNGPDHDQAQHYSNSVMDVYVSRQTHFIVRLLCCNSLHCITSTACFHGLGYTL